MKITKLEQRCLLVEENGIAILIDPGSYPAQNSLKNVDFVIFTHEHSDHFHLDSLKILIKDNPKLEIITNKSVGLILEKESIIFNMVEHGRNFNASGIMIEGFGKNHAQMHSSIPVVQNTGYFIANKLFFPGDAFIFPKKQIEILALPVAGPWMKLSEAIDYALEIKPKVCFPMYEDVSEENNVVYRVPLKILESKGIKFTVLEIKKDYEF